MALQLKLVLVGNMEISMKRSIRLEKSHRVVSVPGLDIRVAISKVEGNLELFQNELDSKH
jgi:hypothetical protein